MFCTGSSDFTIDTKGAVTFRKAVGQLSCNSPQSTKSLPQPKPLESMHSVTCPMPRLIGGRCHKPAAGFTAGGHTRPSIDLGFFLAIHHPQGALSQRQQLVLAGIHSERRDPLCMLLQSSHHICAVGNTASDNDLVYLAV